MGLFQFWKKSNKKIGRGFLDIQTFTLSQAQYRPMLLCQEQSKSHVLLEKAKSGHLETCTGQNKHGEEFPKASSWPSTAYSSGPSPDTGASRVFHDP